MENRVILSQGHFKVTGNPNISILTNYKKSVSWAAWVAQRFSAAFGPGCDPGDRGSSPTSRSQRKKQTPCREPDMELDPGSPGSHPGPKAALNH